MVVDMGRTGDVPHRLMKDTWTLRPKLPTAHPAGQHNSIGASVLCIRGPLAYGLRYVNI